MLNPTRAERTKALRHAIQNRILVLDGAMGTALLSRTLTASDFGGELYEGCNEYLCLTRPDIIEAVHASHLEAGCDVIETNTFGATPLVLDEFGLGAKAAEINIAAAQLAQTVASRFSTPERLRFVAGSIGPTTKAISVTGGITFDELITHFEIQAKALTEGGADYLLVETCQDTRNIKCALLGIDRAFEQLGYTIPIAVSATVEPMGTMLAGQSVESLLTSLAHRDLLYLGLNCGTGPEFMTDHIRSLAALSPFPIAVVPNAGLPDEEGHFLETPEMVGRVVERFIQSGWLNVIGGCCGTHAGHIAELARIARLHSPRTPVALARSTLSGVDCLEITPDIRPVIVGERTNVIGSRAFKKLICEEKFEEAAEIAKAQIKNGAHIIDVCLANPDRDELHDVEQFLDKVVKKIRVPLMIDSTDEKVIERALTYCQGKAIINSINLEDGEERFDLVVPLAKKYGAALVVGTIDDDPTQGMGVSRSRKLEIACREYHLLTEKWKIAPEDIYFDPLVFPCATGDAQYVGSAEETIEGIRLIKAEFPRVKTVLGISNVSFGLPGAGREVLNSVFLYHCVQAGLDLAIVNAEKLERFASIPAEELAAAEDLIFNRGDDPISKFVALFRDRKIKTKAARSDLPLDARIANYIIEGTRDGLNEDLEEALRTRTPLEVINGPLMAGMDEVGRLFNGNKLIVAEVLQSAEAMKAAVSYLEPKMDRSESSNRGKIVLATVKGDVHDIGKNLVEIILSNNGFKVVNLGIKVLPETLIQAVREHQPDMIGLSGLLVKSAQQMIVTAEDFSRAGIAVPVLVGGAALTERFVDRKIAPAYGEGTVAYASDAMQGLELAKRVVDAHSFRNLREELSKRRKLSETADLNNLNSGPKPDALTPIAPEDLTRRSDSVSILENVPQPPDWDRHILRNTPIETIWSYINPLMIYGRHLGVNGKSAKLLGRLDARQVTEREVAAADPRATEIWAAVQSVKQEFGGTEILQPAAVYQFFKASAQGNRIKLFSDQGAPLSEIEFPRQLRGNRLCLADYLQPSDGAPTDSLALFVVTVGRGVRELAESLKNRGDYLRCHVLQVLALESAEAYAELIHASLRSAWGYPDSPETTMLERFQAKYHGKRYSFGYPACPRLDDQSILFNLIRPEDIGVQLTDGFMMDPEASVSAIVFHHPDATYYSVGSASEDSR